MRLFKGQVVWFFCLAVSMGQIAGDFYLVVSGLGVAVAYIEICGAWIFIFGLITVNPSVVRPSLTLPTHDLKCVTLLT